MLRRCPHRVFSWMRTGTDVQQKIDGPESAGLLRAVLRQKGAYSLGFLCSACLMV